MSVSLSFLAALTIVLHACVALAQHAIGNSAEPGRAAALYYAGAAALVACYGLVLRAIGERPPGKTWTALVAVPGLIQVAWILVPPMLSIDAYSYLVDAVHLHRGINPYQHAVKEAAGSEFGQALARHGWRPHAGVSPYGPVWMNLVSALGPIAEHVDISVRLVKVIAASATAVTAWLIFLSAPPHLRVRAFTAFWWNPVVIIEGAGEGHNDAVMVAAVVCALWCLRRRAVVAAAAALTAAALTKWVPLFFVPACVRYAYRHGLLTRRTACTAGIMVVLLTVIAYWPLWVGAATFAGIRSVAGARLVASATGPFAPVLAQHPKAYALVRACLALPLFAAVIDGAATADSARGLSRACATIAVIYVLIATPLYWPWYVVMPIALLALSDDIPLILVLTATSRLVAPLNLIRLHHGFSIGTEVWVTTAIAVWLPSAFFCWRKLRSAIQSKGLMHLTRGDCSA